MRSAARDGDPAAAAEPRYAGFWRRLGDTFPDLGGAASTAFYFENEKRLLVRYLPDLARCTLLKTDLWDEAKNTRILQWVSQRGARVFGIDVSEPIVHQARTGFRDSTLGAAVADVRRLPFPEAAFDAVYSMGTIEHFPDSQTALSEMHRVLKPGGCAIVGVPNRHDPFLRPVLASLLQRLGLYAYGYEKSFSRRTLRAMLEQAGFEVTAETAILFLPGWLRMLDLACHVRCRPLARLTAAAISPFAFLDARVPTVRRHGYLLASVGVRRR
jgi:SAM-dependent methyltransferase